jgi:hypothetical protein
MKCNYRQVYYSCWWQRFVDWIVDGKAIFLNEA